jgi:SAM-dependent methyltransferase
VEERAVLEPVAVLCKRCGEAEANTDVLFPGDAEATALCSDCKAAVVQGVRSEVATRLKTQPPFPGEDVLYLPVELDQCRSWRVLREDSAARAALMKGVIEEVKSGADGGSLSYLDVGCGTGYFCHEMALLGLESKGVDVAEDDVEVARLLESFLRHDGVEYVVSDIRSYLHDTREEPVDVTSCFSVITDVIVEKSLASGLDALAWLFEKTGRVCFLEMGYESNDPYGQKLRRLIDRPLVRQIMEKTKMFDEIRCYEATEHGLLGDLFVGIKSTRTGAGAPNPDTSFSNLRNFAEEIELVEIVSPLLKRLLARFPDGDYFRLLEEKGIHLLPVDHYQPIPDTRRLGDDLWDVEPRETLPGVDLNTKGQLELLTKRFPKFRDEYDAFSTGDSSEAGFSLGNPEFSGTDALAYYCMVRTFSPARIIETSPGPFTMVAIEAARRNKPSPVISVAPQTRDSVVQEAGVEMERVDEMGIQVFQALGENDILFLDSSHVSRIGGDVNYLYLKVLPKLKPGVIVHVRDIFLPYEYPKQWVLGEKRFWNEQYLLHAFLAFNSDWEVLLANNYLAWHFSDAMKKTFPKSPWWGGGSFWMRRRPAP